MGRIDKREKRVDPANWASLKPFGIGQQKPNNYRELWRAFKENRDNAAYAWRILTQGTCDGCSLGTMGMRDWTMEEIQPLQHPPAAVAPQHHAGVRRRPARRRGPAQAEAWR